ncbi:hypothetical protein V3W47_00595 [Deinococcus sp. YIM 134068]|uniref:hypothetical protein n=1 Tax=Deinococcus lichenicola TaxID=3118910 RepID=UPI002F92FAE6
MNDQLRRTLQLLQQNPTGADPQAAASNIAGWRDLLEGEPGAEALTGILGRLHDALTGGDFVGAANLLPALGQETGRLAANASPVNRDGLQRLTTVLQSALHG